MNNIHDKQVTETDASEAESNMASDHEMLLRESKTPPLPDPPNKAAWGKLKSFLTQVNWRKIVATVCLWIAYFLCAAGFSTIGPFFPEEALQKGASSAMIGVIISVSPLAVVVIAPVTGYLLPYTGAWIPTFSGLLLVGAVYILLGLALLIPSVWGFIFFCLLLRVLEGLGAAMFYTATFSTFAKLFPNSIGTLMGLFQVASGLGYSLGRPLGGLLYYLGGYKLPFIVIGAATFIFTFPCGLLVRKIKVDKREQTLPWTVLLSFSTDLFYIIIALILVVGFTATHFVTPILQPFLIDSFNLGPIQVAIVFFVGGSAYAITDIPIGAFADKLTSTYSVYISVLGLVILAVGNMLYVSLQWIQHGLWIVYVARAVMGIGLSFSSVPVYPNLIRIAKRYINCDNEDEVAGITSFTSGVVSSSLFLGQFLGPVFGGVLYDFVTFSTTALVFTQIALAQAILLAVVTLIDRYTYK